MSNDLFAFEDILGVTPPWFVEAFVSDAASGQATIKVNFTQGSRFAHLQTPGEHPVHDIRIKLLRLRDLKFPKHEFYLEVRVPRVRLPDGKVVVVEPDWAGKHSECLLRVKSTIEFSYEGHPYSYRVPEGFKIDVGEKVCISGISGSGKSTILTMLAGLRRLSKGEIAYNFGNHRLTLAAKQNLGPALWGQIGFSFQRPELLSALTVEGNMRVSLGTSADSLGRRLFPETKRDVNGEAVRTDEWTEVKHKRVAALSGGQKLRLGLVRAFGHGQSLVILDEPTGALDPDNRTMVADFIKDQAKNVGLLVVAHDDDFVRSLSVDRTYVTLAAEFQGGGGAV